MLKDKEVFEINQSVNAKGKVVPGRDTFYFEIHGDIIDPEKMGEEDFFKCFSPSSLQMYMVGDKKYYSENENNWPVYTEDHTKCFYKSKLSDHLDVTCKAPAVINGKETDSKDLFTVLFASDLHECVGEK